MGNTLFCMPKRARPCNTKEWGIQNHTIYLCHGWSREGEKLGCQHCLHGAGYAAAAAAKSVEIDDDVAQLRVVGAMTCVDLKMTP